LGRELAHDVEMREAANRVAKEFGRVFERDVVQASLEDNQNHALRLDLPVLMGQ
jgi:hypothetical protein